MNAALSLLVLSSLHIGSDYILAQWWIGITLCFLVIALVNLRKYGWLANLCFLYSVMNCLYTLFFDRYAYAPALVPEAIRIATLYALISIVSIGFLCAACTTKIDDFICKALPHYTAINACIVIVGYLTGMGRMPEGNGYSGFLDYAGMNGCLIAIMFPMVMVFSKQNVLYFCLYALAVILSKSSIPYGVAMIGITATMLHRHRKNLKLRSILGMTVIPLTLGFLLEGSRFFSSAFRFDAYRAFIKEWLLRHDYVFGTGFGTFQVMAPMMQCKQNFMLECSGHGVVWLWLHSDWLQLIFEGGIVGFLLYALLFLSVLKNLLDYEDDGTAFGIVIAIAASAIFDYPARYFIFSFVGAWIISLVWRVRRDEGREVWVPNEETIFFLRSLPSRLRRNWRLRRNQRGKDGST